MKTYIVDIRFKDISKRVQASSKAEAKRKVKARLKASKCKQKIDMIEVSDW